MTLADSLYPSTIKATFANITVLMLAQPPIKINTGPPYFITPLLSSVTVEVGASFEVLWPDVKDPDGDAHTRTVSGMGSIATFSEVKATGVTIRPVRSTDVGVYTIGVVLKDQSMQSKYTVKVNIIEKVVEKVA